MTAMHKIAFHHVYRLEAEENGMKLAPNEMPPLEYVGNTIDEPSRGSAVAELLNVPNYRDKIDPRKARFAAFLAMPEGVRPTFIQIAAELGVDVTTLWRWRHTQQVLQLVPVIIKANLVKRLPKIFEAIVEKAETGDVSAARLALQLHGVIGDDGATNVFIHNDNRKVSMTAEEVRETINRLKSLSHAS